MPGTKNINIRASEEDIAQLKAGAAALKVSMTTLMLRSALFLANKALGKNPEVVGTSTPQPQKPAKSIHRSPSGICAPDTEIGDMTKAEILAFLADRELHEREDEERRLERAALDEQDYY